MKLVVDAQSRSLQRKQHLATMDFMLQSRTTIVCVTPPCSKVLSGKLISAWLPTGTKALGVPAEVRGCNCLLTPPASSTVASSWTVSVVNTPAVDLGGLMNVRR